MKRVCARGLLLSRRGRGSIPSIRATQGALVKRRAILRSLPAAVAVPALATAGRTASGGAPPPPVAARPVRMVVGCQRGPTDDRMLAFFKRHGVDHISGAPEGGEDAEGPWSPDALPRLKERCDKAGIA